MPLGLIPGVTSGSNEFSGAQTIANQIAGTANVFQETAGNLGLINKMVRDVDEKLRKPFENILPHQYLVDRLPQRMVDALKFECWRTRNMKTHILCNVSVSSGAPNHLVTVTPVTATDLAQIVGGMVVTIDHPDAGAVQAYVEAVQTTTFTCSFYHANASLTTSTWNGAWPDGAATQNDDIIRPAWTAVSTNDVYVHMGVSSWQQGSASPDTFYLTDTGTYNTVSLMKHAKAVDETTMALKYHANPREIKARLRAECIEEFMVMQEASFLFEEQAFYGDSSEPRTRARGLFGDIVTNLQHVTDRITEWGLLNVMRPMFRDVDPSKRVIYASESVIFAIQKLNGQQLQIIDVQTDGKKNFDYRVLHTPWGNYPIMYHRLLDYRRLQIAGYDDNSRGWNMMILDYNTIHKCPLRSRQLRIEENIQANDLDAFKFQLKEEAGQEVTLEESNGLITFDAVANG